MPSSRLIPNQLPVMVVLLPPIWRAVARFEKARFLITVPETPEETEIPLTALVPVPVIPAQGSESVLRLRCPPSIVTGSVMGGRSPSRVIVPFAAVPSKLLAKLIVSVVPDELLDSWIAARRLQSELVSAQTPSSV